MSKTLTFASHAVNVLRTISLNSFIGKTITLKFSGSEDSSLATSFVLDDVSVAVQ